MKNSDACIKCGQAQIIGIGPEGPFNVANFIQAGLTNCSKVGVARYLCTSCGYGEDRVGDQRDLETLAKKFGPGEGAATSSR